MAVYKYVALDGRGNEVKDTIEANNSRDAIVKIRGLDLFPTEVKKISGEEIAGSGINWTFAPTVAAALDERWRGLLASS